MADQGTREATEFDANSPEHQAFRAFAESLLGMELDPAIDLDEIDLREEKRPA